MSRWEIYKLTDLNTNQPFYIGQTRRGLLNRLQQHITESKTYNTSDNSKIKHIREIEFKVGIETVDFALTEDEALLRERFWIKQYITDGHRLYNIRDISNKKLKYTTAKISSKILYEVKIYCAENDITILDFMKEASIKYMAKADQS